MYLIGLTGNIASGKSTVRRMLEELGARTIDADALARTALDKGTPAYQAVVEKFGADVLQPNGEIDRQRLGASVFADPKKLKLLEAIVHPAVSLELGRLLHEAREPIVVIEVVKLIEAGLNSLCDEVWLVITPDAEAVRRLRRGRGLSESEARLRLDAQPGLEEKVRLADVVIDNSGTIESTRAQVARAFAAIRPEKARNKEGLLAAIMAAAVLPKQSIDL